MNTRMMFARAVAGAAMFCLVGCWSPLVAGKTWRQDSDVHGLYIQPFFGHANTVNGISAGICGRDIASPYLTAKCVNGVALGFISEVGDQMTGLQIGGLMAGAETCRGVQLSLVNITYPRGAYAIGRYKDPDESRCVQIGLINVCGDHWFPLVNFNFRDCKYDKEKGLKFRPW